VAYNWGPARVKANLDQRAAERSYGIADADLTASVGWSLYSMRKDWNQAKARVAPWWMNVAGMVKNRSLARVISDAGFGQIRRQLAYKTAWNSGTLGREASTPHRAASAQVRRGPSSSNGRITKIH
jgi:hypothetical protein